MDSVDYDTAYGMFDASNETSCPVVPVSAESVADASLYQIDFAVAFVGIVIVPHV